MFYCQIGGGMPNRRWLAASFGSLLLPENPAQRGEAGIGYLVFQTYTRPGLGWWSYGTLRICLGFEFFRPQPGDGTLLSTALPAGRYVRARAPCADTDRL